MMKPYMPIAILALSACTTTGLEGLEDAEPIPRCTENCGGASPPPSWSNLPFPATRDIAGISQEVTYTHNGAAVTSVGIPSEVSTTSSYSFTYDSAGRLERVIFIKPTGYVSPPFEYINFNKQIGDSIDSLGTIGLPTFISAASSSRPQNAIVADPYVHRWNYQVFGVWEQKTYDRTLSNPLEYFRTGGTIGAMSAGWPTPDTSIPTAGSANFAGALGGMYISPDGSNTFAHANVSVAADFAARTLDFSSNGTRTTDLATFTSRPDLDLAGTLTYAPNVNLFNGTLTNRGGTLSGTSTGKFYGPRAQELGGVFFLKAGNAGSVEAFGGAYGAKR